MGMLAAYPSPIPCFIKSNAAVVVVDAGAISKCQVERGHIDLI